MVIPSAATPIKRGIPIRSWIGKRIFNRGSMVYVMMRVMMKEVRRLIVAQKNMELI